MKMPLHASGIFVRSSVIAALEYEQIEWPEQDCVDDVDTK
jgi:hypothetical protein